MNIFPERSADMMADRKRKLRGTGAGKGDSPRPVDPEKYAEGYDAAFGQCRTHPSQEPSSPDTPDCIVCRRLRREYELENHDEKG
jgi:hypothetical protein